ncbi:aminotransferase, class V [Dictyocaulus viviparus]|uniref:Alanine--glyoxylate aminotransferase n=1 Tax=Dictyocaulus viviparus TaxID=29172 RepID=A0A0D8Y3Q2_DICVI|nr:aminotransferase, class V [Dictyocaulus viviparus]
MMCRFRVVSKYLIASKTPKMNTFARMSTYPPPARLLQPMVIPPRQLFGPGPSNMRDVVANTQSMSLLGHLHPEFINVMSEVREGLQYIFKTHNTYTFAVSGTGHAGMECAIVNLLEKDDVFLVVDIGIWGKRAADLGTRIGATVHTVTAPHGCAVENDVIKEALNKYKPSVLFVCHGESSTGVKQPLEGLAEVCSHYGTLLLVDTVASLGGAEFRMDEWGVDCVYSATQKVLNAPPGLAPISFSDKAIHKIKNRKVRVPTFYFDVMELGNYWGCDDQPIRYHHTAPISCVYALRSALAVIANEGIDESVCRHEDNAKFLYQKLQEVGLQCFVEHEKWRLPCLTTVKVPDGVDWKGVIEEMMKRGTEIAGGLGPTVGKLWRIGTFGCNSDKQKIEKVVTLLAETIAKKSNL